MYMFKYFWMKPIKTSAPKGTIGAQRKLTSIFESLSFDNQTLGWRYGDGLIALHSVVYYIIRWSNDTSRQDEMGKTTETGGDETNEKWAGTDVTRPKCAWTRKNIPSLQQFVAGVV